MGVKDRKERIRKSKRIMIKRIICERGGRSLEGGKGKKEILRMWH